MKKRANNPKTESLAYPFFPICNTCKHFHRDSSGPSCAAFEVIPQEILTGEFDHTKPVRGDNGVQYEKAEVQNG